jgi:hypothetical protein
MPLKPGKKNIGPNIAEMTAAGYPLKQARAAALRKALDEAKKKKPK